MSPRASQSSTPLGFLSGQSRFLQKLDDAAVTSAVLSDMKEVDAPLNEWEDDFDDALLETALDQDDFNDDVSPKRERISKPDLTLSPRLKSMIKPDFDLSSNRRKVHQPDFTSSSAIASTSTSGGSTTRTEQCTGTTSTRSTTATSLTETVIAKQQERVASQAALQGPKATFRTVGADSLPASTREATRLGHTAKLDPLSGARLRWVDVVAESLCLLRLFVVMGYKT
jgi:hypothetical protein